MSTFLINVVFVWIIIHFFFFCRSHRRDFYFTFMLLGITISFSMRAEEFVRVDTLMILGIGLVAFVFDTIGGVLFAKLLNLFLKNKINPMVGAAGISAFPMSSRVVQKMAVQEQPGNIILMHAAGANVSGQIASVIAGGLVIKLVTAVL